MMPKRFSSQVLQRTLERRQREDDAPRLHALVPRLRALDIAFSEGEGGAFASIDHVRHVVVARAPALFEQRCANPSCKGGEHQFTSELVAGLRRDEARIEGEDRCLAPMGASSCQWVLKYVATARYE
jgi:hypothetical protein